MKLLNTKDSDTPTRSEIESVVESEREYKLIESWLRRPGLKLFAWNKYSDKIEEVIRIQGSTAYITLIDGELGVDSNKSYEKLYIDPKCIYFEALNITTARTRVIKYKSKKIKSLFNLKPSGGTINFFQ